jgi:hypothetical protein
MERAAASCASTQPTLVGVTSRNTVTRTSPAAGRLLPRRHVPVIAHVDSGTGWLVIQLLRRAAREPTPS